MPGKDDFGSQEDALARMFRDIVTYLRGGERSEFVATFSDGLEVLKVIDAIERSDSSGAWVGVGSDGA
jgi:predicted dehydrogenase